MLFACGFYYGCSSEMLDCSHCYHAYIIRSNETSEGELQQAGILCSICNRTVSLNWHLFLLLLLLFFLFKKKMQFW
jgi:hypothetical protein